MTRDRNATFAKRLWIPAFAGKTEYGRDENVPGVNKP